MKTIKWVSLYRETKFGNDISKLLAFEWSVGEDAVAFVEAAAGYALFIQGFEFEDHELDGGLVLIDLEARFNNTHHLFGLCSKI